MEIILIDWVDAQTISGQYSIEDFKDELPVKAKSVGFLIADKKDCYIIADEM